MDVELSSRVVALIDADQQCRHVLSYAKALPGPLTILASVDTKLANNEPDVVRSLSAEPSMSEVLALAGERGAPWVVMRRAVTAPEALITELIVGAGKADTETIPGFGVLLVSDEPRPTNRVLVVADRTHGPMSGLMIYLATRVAHNSGAQLDVLVIGGPGEDVSSDDEFDALAVNREQEYFDAAQALAAEDGAQINWLAAGDIERPEDLVTAQLAKSHYDLVIDDIGDLAIGSALRTGISPADALAPGQVGALPLALLTRTDIDVLLVIDGIRVGMLSRRLLAVGAAAAAALAVITGAGAGAGGTPDVNPDLGDATASGATSGMGEESQAILDDLSQATDTAARQDAVDSSSRSAKRSTPTKESQAATKKAKSSKIAAKPKAPKGGVDDKQLAKQKKAEKKAQAKFQKAQKAAAKAEAAAAAAAAEVQDIRDEAERAQLEITSAQQTYDEAALASQMASFSTATLSQSVAETVVDATESAQQAQAEAEAWLAGATARGEQALEDLQDAQKAAEKAAAKAEKADEQADVVKTQYQAQKQKTEVYEENVIETRQSPLKKGTFHYSARYGQAGSAWSKGYHTGLDFAASTGTNVYAADSGKVISAGYDGAYGNRIVIQHSDGTRTTYNHLSNMRVSVGQSVDPGDHIGDVGNTGNSFGSHLHFEVTRGGDGWSGGSFLDPEEWLAN